MFQHRSNGFRRRQALSPFERFLESHETDDSSEHTLLIMPNIDAGVYPAKYCVHDTDLEEFYNLYVEHVFDQGNRAHFTERQKDLGPLVIDLDFEYETSVITRQHKPEHVVALVQCIGEAIARIKTLDPSRMPPEGIECYIMEKKQVKLNEEETKDGIHVLVTVEMDVPMKAMVRDYLIRCLPELWQHLPPLPLMKSMDLVVDKGILQNSSPWMLYGSRKPGNDPYLVTELYLMTVNETLDGFTCVGQPIFERMTHTEFVKAYFHRLTARSTEHLVKLPMNPLAATEYEMKKFKLLKAGRTSVRSLENRLVCTRSPEELTSKEEVLQYWEEMKARLRSSEHFKVEAHDYVMVLPPSYYEKGSYYKWIRVGWALRNVGDDMFIVWLKMSMQQEGFDFATEVPAMHDSWTNGKDPDGLTLKSIIYWVKSECSPDVFRSVKNSTVNYHINHAISTESDYDIAVVLYILFKENYVCVNIRDRLWYEFNSNIWVPLDEGTTLRKKISTAMFDEFKKVVDERTTHELNLQNAAATVPPPAAAAAAANMVTAAAAAISTREFQQQKKKLSMLTSTLTQLKTTGKKNNIMKESMELFYDPLFFKKLDTDNFLLGCVNCVIDIKNRHHRRGKLDDYISKSTNLEYHPLRHYEQFQPGVIAEIHTFMGQLFPIDEVREYMWEHLASTLVGNNENQTFNIYTGNGANGKSKLVEFMSKVLGDYKATVPVSLVTSKRTNIGGVSPEIAALRGIRYAVMQEPTKGDTINEGVLKELTGSDPLQCRALYKDSVTFIPQFKLAVCTNTLMDIKNVDDEATWRRIRVVDYKAKFTKRPYSEEYPREKFPYQFPIDLKIDQKFEVWAPVMLSMLVDKVYQTQGVVRDCQAVLDSSLLYRKDQDVFLQFIDAAIEGPHEDVQPEKLRTTQLNKAFKQWYQNEQQGGNQVQPQVKDLKKYMEKRYGDYPRDGWGKLSLREEYK